MRGCFLQHLTAMITHLTADAVNHRSRVTTPSCAFSLPFFFFNYFFFII